MKFAGSSAFLIMALIACKAAPEPIDVSKKIHNQEANPGTPTPVTPTPTKPDSTPSPVDPTPTPVVNEVGSISAALTAKFGVDMKQLTVLNAAGGEPYKGQTLKFAMKLSSSAAQNLTITPLLTSKVFDDFDKVSLPALKVSLVAGEVKTVAFDLAPFFADAKNAAKQYALGAGGYQISFNVLSDKIAETMINDMEAGYFDVQWSNVVFTVVGSTKEFYTGFNYTKTPITFLRDMVHRNTEVYDTATQKYTSYPTGYEGFLGIRVIFKTIDAPTYPGSDGNDFIDIAPKFFGEKLGLAAEFKNANGYEVNNRANHGFDSTIFLTHQFKGGGVTGGTWSISGPQGDLTEMFLMHEVGHAYGAPHCDPYRGYMMCVGEDHEHYKKDKTYVWLKSTYDTMKRFRDILDQLPADAKFNASSASIWEPSY